MRKILYVLMAVFVLSGCATKKEIEYRDREVTKYVKVFQRDTIINNVHDSVYNNIYTKGDTVYNIKYKERVAYMDRIVIRNDTVTRDSIQIVAKEKTIVKNKIPKFVWILLGINVLICIFVGVKYYLKWKIRI